MAHTALQLCGQFEEDVRPSKGIPGGLISEAMHRPKDADFAGGYLLQLSSEADARGLPKPRVHFTAGENEKRMTAHAEKLMQAIWSEAGAKEVWPKEVWTLERYAHILGTCRLGTDPALSVVNAAGAVHDVPGLYIADNSVFLSSLSVNPAWTIMALSLRTADRFLHKRTCWQ